MKKVAREVSELEAMKPYQFGQNYNKPLRSECTPNYFAGIQVGIIRQEDTMFFLEKPELIVIDSDNEDYNGSWWQFHVIVSGEELKAVGYFFIKDQYVKRFGSVFCELVDDEEVSDDD